MTRTDDTARERQLERYLLGTLSDDERDRLEPRLLADHELFSELDTVEGVLIDRYLEGDLPAEERRLFEERLLPGERVRQRIAMTTSLQQLAERRSDCGQEPEDGWPFWARPSRAHLSAPRQSRASWLAWAACLVFLLSTGYLTTVNIDLKSKLGTIELKREAAINQATQAQREAERSTKALADLRAQTQEEGQSLSELRHEIAQRDDRISQLEHELTSQSPRPSNSGVREPSLTVLFLALATRAHQNEPVLALPVDGPVELQLDLDRYQAEDGLTATVERDGILIWHEQELKSRSSGAETMLPLVLPSQIFNTGKYTIKVKTTKGGESRVIGSYELTASPQ